MARTTNHETKEFLQDVILGTAEGLYSNDDLAKEYQSRLNMLTNYVTRDDWVSAEEVVPLIKDNAISVIKYEIETQKKENQKIGLDAGLITLLCGTGSAVSEHADLPWVSAIFTAAFIYEGYNLFKQYMRNDDEKLDLKVDLDTLQRIPKHEWEVELEKLKPRLYEIVHHHS